MTDVSGRYQLRASAREQTLAPYLELRAGRLESYNAHLRTLPCYALYERYNGHPPLQLSQLQFLHSRVDEAHALLKQCTNEDWKGCLQATPLLLDHPLNEQMSKFAAEDDAVPAHTYDDEPLRPSRSLPIFPRLSRLRPFAPDSPPSHHLPVTPNLNDGPNGFL